ncbi:MAG: hypothetical protein HY683_08420 [Chloroflexi bacterium]|nr:hypothetical protein [Chloroflexota bacterium]
MKSQGLRIGETWKGSVRVIGGMSAVAAGTLFLNEGVTYAAFPLSMGTVLVVIALALIAMGAYLVLSTRLSGEQG